MLPMLVTRQNLASQITTEPQTDEKVAARY